MYFRRTIEQALAQTVLAAKGQASALPPPAIYWQDFFVEEGIYSYDLITAGLHPGTTDSHRAQYVERQRDKVAQEKGDHHSHSADHEWRIQRSADAEMKRFAFHSLSVVYDPRQRKFLRRVEWYKARLIKARDKQRYDMNQGIKDQRCFFIPYPFCYAEWIITSVASRSAWKTLGWSEESYHPADFWNWVLAHPECPLRIEEGEKKALASASWVATPVIALGGITNWRIASNKHKLAGSLRVFTKNRSSVAIVFDAPKKENSCEEVQAKELAVHLKKYGAKDVSHSILPAVVGSTDDGFAVCMELCRRFPEKAKQLAALFGAEILNPSGQDPYSAAVYTRLTRQPDVVIDGEISVSDLVTMVMMAHADGRKAVIGIQAAMGIGKTEGVKSLTAANVASWVNLQVPTYRATLSITYAEKFRIPSLSGLGDEVIREALYPIEEGEPRISGSSYCGESAIKVATNGAGEIKNLQWLAGRIRSGELDGRVLLVLDEISQVIPNWIQGGCKNQVTSRVIEELLLVLAHPLVDVIAMDALLGDAELELLERATRERPWLYQSTMVRPKTLNHYHHPETFKAAITEALMDQKQRPLIATPTKQAALDWAHKARELGRRPLVITSDTTGSSTLRKLAEQFMATPDAVMCGEAFPDHPEWSKGFDSLIITTTVTSGLSLTGGHLNTAFVSTGYMLDGEMAVQMAGRERTIRAVNFYAGGLAAEAFSKLATSDDEEENALSLADGNTSTFLTDLAANMPSAIKDYARQKTVQRNYERRHVLGVSLAHFQSNGYQLRQIMGVDVAKKVAGRRREQSEREANFHNTWLTRLLAGEATEQDVADAMEKEGFSYTAAAEADPRGRYRALVALGLNKAAALGEDHRFTVEDRLLNKVNKGYQDQWAKMDRPQRFAIRKALGFIPLPREVITGQQARKMLESLGYKVSSKRVPKSGERYLILNTEEVG